MLAINRVEELLTLPLEPVKEFQFEGRYYERIFINGLYGDLFYNEAERQVIQVLNGDVKVEYRILTRLGENTYQSGYFGN
ncbi:hypothetical protein [Solibacillus sp. FSL W7-1324]|uniref:hypothetical protein n=1 Tax=Solibacillus sp. FSL W7-1324 TaxID=2921701 RepID=UPI0030FA7801